MGKEEARKLTRDEKFAVQHMEIAEENGKMIDYEVIIAAFSEKNDSEISIEKACKLLHYIFTK